MKRLLPFALALAMSACGPSPTPTPEPTATPEATATTEPTATPDATVANEAYITWARASLDQLGGLITGLAPLFAELQANPSLRTDPDFAQRIGEQLGQAKGHADLIAEYDGEVPPDAREVHAKMVQFATNTGTMTDLYVKGLDNMDAEALTQASALMNLAVPTVEEIGKGLVALRRGE